MNDPSRRKISQRLSHEVEHGGPQQELDIVIELPPPRIPASGSRSERISAARREFAREVESVEQRLVEIGGQVLDSAWINATVKGRVPAARLEELAQHRLVQALDLPARLEPDDSPGSAPDPGRPGEPEDLGGGPTGH